MYCAEQTGLEVGGSCRQWTLVANIYFRKLGRRTCWLDCKKLESGDLRRLCIEERTSGPFGFFAVTHSQVSSKVLSRFKVGSLGGLVSYWF